MLACTLVNTDSQSGLQRSDLTPVSTDGWVSYVGKGVRIGAPADSWAKVPFDFTVASSQLSTLRETDPTVANVFEDLMRLTTDDLYKLILMKKDGTAWTYVTAEPLPADSTFEDAVQSARQASLDASLQPRNQRRVALSIGDAIRWEVTTSPPGSQILNRQFVYLVQHEDQIYYLTFSAQAPDFEDYQQIFEAMAITFWPA